MRVKEIDWETDGVEVELPTAVTVPSDLEEDEIADYLSDQYGWLVNGFVMEAESFGAEKNVMDDVLNLQNMAEKYLPESIRDDAEAIEYSLQYIDNDKFLELDDLPKLNKVQELAGEVVLWTVEMLEAYEEGELNLGAESFGADFTVAMDTVSQAGFRIPFDDEWNMTDDELKEYALKEVREGRGPDYWIEGDGEEETIRITEMTREYPYEPDFEAESFGAEMKLPKLTQTQMDLLRYSKWFLTYSAFATGKNMGAYHPEDWNNGGAIGCYKVTSDGWGNDKIARRTLKSLLEKKVLYATKTNYFDYDGRIRKSPAQQVNENPDLVSELTSVCLGLTSIGVEIIKREFARRVRDVVGWRIELTLEDGQTAYLSDMPDDIAQSLDDHIEDVRWDIRGEQFGAEMDGKKLIASSYDLADGSMMVGVGTETLDVDDPDFMEMMIDEDGKIKYFTLPIGLDNWERSYRIKPTHYGKMKTQNETNESAGGDFIRTDGEGKYAESFGAELESGEAALRIVVSEGQLSVYHDASNHLLMRRPIYAGEWDKIMASLNAAESFGAELLGYPHSMSDRQKHRIKKLGGRIDKAMTRSEASKYIKSLMAMPLHAESTDCSVCEGWGWNEELDMVCDADGCIGGWVVPKKPSLLERGLELGAGMGMGMAGVAILFGLVGGTVGFAAETRKKRRD